MASTRDKKLIRYPISSTGGVCTGLAKFYGINKRWVQVGFVISSIAYGFPVLLYLILWEMIPKRSDDGVDKTNQV